MVSRERIGGTLGPQGGAFRRFTLAGNVGPIPEGIELGLIGLSFHLDLVGAPVSPAGLSQPGLQATVGRQQ
jgi:hypothetical protein